MDNEIYLLHFQAIFNILRVKSFIVLKRNSINDILETFDRMKLVFN